MLKLIIEKAHRNIIIRNLTITNYFHFMYKIKKLIILLIHFVPMYIYSQNVTVYVVDRDDYELSNLKTEIAPQNEIGVDFNTLILVYDRYRDEIIGGWGSYRKFRPSNKEFKKIIDDAVMDLYNGVYRIRCDEINPKNKGYDGILGLRWGMPMAEALAHLHSMSFTNVKQADAEHLMVIDDVFWNGIRFDCIRLGYMVSNKQNKYLCDLSFTRFCNNAQEAKQIRESIAGVFIMEFGRENVKEEIDENGFKKYTVWQEIESEIKISRINLFIGTADAVYATCLSYNGWSEASKMITNE